MSRLIFYNDTHSYQIDGETLPSVTEILRFISREIYADATSWKLDNAADRGTRSAMTNARSGTRTWKRDSSILTRIGTSDE